MHFPDGQTPREGLWLSTFSRSNLARTLLITVVTLGLIKYFLFSTPSRPEGVVSTTAPARETEDEPVPEKPTKARPRKSAAKADRVPERVPDRETSRKSFFDNTEYEVTSATANGREWEMVVTAKSLEGDKQIRFGKARAITESGRTLEIPQPMRGNAVRLPEGVKIQIKLSMGSLPKGLTEFSRIECYPFGFAFGARPEVLVFEDVVLGASRESSDEPVRKKLAKDATLKRAAKPESDPEPGARRKHTFYNVEYEVTSATAYGSNWEMILTTKSLEGDQEVRFSKARAITESGRTLEIPQLMRGGPVRLPEGIKIQIKLNMGNLPKGLTEFSRVELYLQGVGFAAHSRIVMLEDVVISD